MQRVLPREMLRARSSSCGRKSPACTRTRALIQTAYNTSNTTYQRAQLGD